MKKQILTALLLSLIPLLAQANCEVDNTGGDSADTKECTSSNLSPLTSSIDIQASAGVLLNAQAGKVNGSFSSDSSGDAVGVSSCHDSGSAAFYGHTEGGSIQKNGNFDMSNCSSGSLDYSTASSS